MIFGTREILNKYAYALGKKKKMRKEQDMTIGLFHLSVIGLFHLSRDDMIRLQNAPTWASKRTFHQKCRPKNES